MDSSSNSSNNDDAEWCQIKETLAMLTLSSAQIESSMHEDTTVFKQLSDSLIDISRSSNLILENLDSVDLNNMNMAGNNLDLEAVKTSAQAIASQIGASMTACQIHDRNTQRLEHVTLALSRLGEIIASPEDYDSQQNWQKLQSEIKNSYTMESERLMFEHIMMGATVEEALEIYHHNFNQPAPDDDSDDEIELF